VTREDFLISVSSIFNISFPPDSSLPAPFHSFFAGFFKHNISKIGDGGFFGVIRVCHDRDS
jgi:hypothetical protein